MNLRKVRPCLVITVFQTLAFWSWQHRTFILDLESSSYCVVVYTIQWICLFGFVIGMLILENFISWCKNFYSQDASSTWMMHLSTLAHAAEWDDALRLLHNNAWGKTSLVGVCPHTRTQVFMWCREMYAACTDRHAWQLIAAGTVTVPMCQLNYSQQLLTAAHLWTQEPVYCMGLNSRHARNVVLEINIFFSLDSHKSR